MELLVNLCFFCGSQQRNIAVSKERIITSKKRTFCEIQKQCTLYFSLETHDTIRQVVIST